MNTEEVYKQLTGVDIIQQKQLWDERGRGYYGEYLTFCDLLHNIPGCGKILLNLQIPRYYNKNKDTELDLVYIHETGIYVFEVKHYKGTIYGRDTDENWTQYFRTLPNKRFYNPIRQNQGHIRALSELLGDARVYSFVVFTNPEADIRIKNNDDTAVVCSLRNLDRAFEEITTNRSQIYSATEINNIFVKLLPYAPVMEQPVVFGGKELPFHQYCDLIKQNADDMIETVRHQAIVAKRRHLTICAAVAVIVAIAAVVFSFVNAGAYKKQTADADAARIKAEAETEEMRRNFTRVEPWNNGEFDIADDLVTVQNVSLTPSSAIKNAVELEAMLVAGSDEYGLYVTKEASYVVLLKNGQSKEYPLFGDDTNYLTLPLVIKGISYWPELKLGKTVLTDLSLDDVEYIKLKGLDLYQQYLQPNSLRKQGIELEVYKR